MSVCKYQLESSPGLEGYKQAVNQVDLDSAILADTVSICYSWFYFINVLLILEQEYNDECVCLNLPSLCLPLLFSLVPRLVCSKTYNVGKT